ncbi:MAG: ankyrin repeat domain-containing protein [Bacteroidales bacterium]
MRKVLIIVAMAGILLKSTSAQEIFEAVKTNDLAKIQVLTGNDPGLVSAKDELGNTPLHTSVIAGSIPIAEFLLSKGSDINALNNQLMTPLHVAIYNKQEAVALLLIEKGADLNRQDLAGNTPLHQTAHSNNATIAGLLISKGAGLEIRNRNNYTPLGALTRSTHNFEVAEVLVKGGADVNARWTNGATPLNDAASYSDGRVIDLLMDHLADFDTTGENLRFTLNSSVSRGYVRLFDAIIEKCGEGVLADAGTKRALMRSATTGNSLEMVKKLQLYNIPLDLSKSITGATPLHSVAGNPDALEMIQFLVQYGCDINARTNDGRSAYNIAEAAGNGEVMELLKSLGADTGPQQFPVITGPYLGQIPPGKEMKRFAPGIVYLDHTTISVSPDGNEMYWGNGYSILYSAIRGGQWTMPAYPSFSGPNDLMFYDDVPFVSPDNQRLFFTSRRPVDTLSARTKKENIWYVERTSTGWSDPRPAGAAVNAMSLHWQVTVSRNGTLWFGGSDQNSFGAGDIYYSRLVNGEYTQPVNAGPVINTGESEMMPFIAPDESYLFFFRAILQRPYLFISFKGDDGQWQEPKPVDRFPVYVGVMVSPDGKYLFTYNQWVSADFIEELRREK